MTGPTHGHGIGSMGTPTRELIRTPQRLLLRGQVGLGLPGGAQDFARGTGLTVACCAADGDDGLVRS